MTKTDKRVFLYTDLHSHVYALNDEAQAERELKKIVIQIDKILGVDHSLNYSNLLSIGTDYLVEVYREMYLSNSPLHLQFSAIVETQTNVKLHHVQNSINDYNRFIAPLNQFKPNISDKGLLISNIKEEKFRRFLEPSLTKYYNYLIKLLKVADELQNHVVVNNTNPHIAHFVSNGLLCVGNKLSINNQYFQDEL